MLPEVRTVQVDLFTIATAELHTVPSNSLPDHGKKTLPLVYTHHLPCCVASQPKPLIPYGEQYRDDKTENKLLTVLLVAALRESDPLGQNTGAIPVISTTS